MRWGRSLLVFSILVASASAYAQLDFSTTRQEKKTRIRSQERKAQGVEGVEFPALDSRPVPELVESIQSFTVLIRSAGAGRLRERHTMQINRASAYVAIAQKVLKTGGAQSQARAVKYLQLADKDSLGSLIELQKHAANSDLMSRAQFLLGLSNLYQGHASKAANHFEAAESLDPNASWVSLVNLFVAEQRFIESNFAAALKLYQKIAKSEEPSPRLMAYYRQGWSQFNLKNFNGAVHAFQQALLLARDQKSSMTQEVAADLIHVALRSKNASDFLKVNESVREEELSQDDRLGAAIEQYREKRDSASLSHLWSRFKDSKEMDLENRITLLAALITVHAGPFATSNYSKAVRWVDGTLEKMTYQFDDATEEDAALEEEYRLAIKALVDTYSRRVRSSDNKYAATQVMQDLLWILRAYPQRFPSSKYVSRVRDLGQDACIEMNDIVCLEEYLSMGDLAVLRRERVFSKIWKTLEDRKDPKQIRFFLDKYESKTSTPKLRKEVLIRAIELRSKEKDWEGAMDRVQRALQEFPDESRLVQQKAHLQFKQSKFEDIVNDPLIETVAAKDANVREIYEQSAIRILDTGINQSADAVHSLKVFEATKRHLSPSSQALVLRDYALLLLKQKKYLPFVEHVRANKWILGGENLKSLLPQACRWSLVFMEPAGCRDLLTYFKTQNAETKLSPKSKGKAKPKALSRNPLGSELAFYEYVAGLLEDPSTSSSLEEIWALDKAYRATALSWFAFGNSATFISETLRSKISSPELGTFALMNYRNIYDSPFDEDSLDAKYFALKKKFPNLFPLNSSQNSSLGKRLEKLNLPAQEGKERDQALAIMIRDLRKIREDLSKELEPILSADRLVILRSLAEKTKLVAEALEEASVPTGLDEAGVKTYKAEIEKINEEFDEASEDYSNSRETLEKNTKDDRNLVQSSVPEALNPSGFDWPDWKHELGEDSGLAGLYSEALQKKEYLRLLVSWELVRAPLALQSSVFHWGSTGLILSLSPKFGTREFMFNSLSATGDDGKKALEEWKSSL